MPNPTNVIGSRAARLLVGASLLSLAACGDEPFTKLFTTEHFVYYVEEGAVTPCDGTAQWLERYYNAYAKFLGATLPPGERIEYYLFRGPVAPGCPPNMIACARHRMIRAAHPVHPHEIVHANTFLLGEPPLLFQEGIAMVLGCAMSEDRSGPLDTSEPIEQLVETAAFVDRCNAGDVPAVYDASGSFVRYLIDEIGASRFLSFYARASWSGSRAEIDAVFQAEMGVGLDAAFSDWRTKPAPYPGDVCLRLMECDASMPLLVDTDVTLRCGPLTQDAFFRFEVPKERIIHVTTETALAKPQPVPRVNFYRCTGGDALGTAGVTAGFQRGADLWYYLDPAQPANAFALDVPPGEYVAWFWALTPARLHLDVEERRSPMRNTACQAAEEPLALDDKHQTTLVSRWIERTCHGPWCPGQSWDVSIGATGGALEAQALTMDTESVLSPSELYICSEPCPQDASSCEVVALDLLEGGRVRSKQTFEPGTVLHIGAPAAPNAGHFAVQLRVAPE